MTIGMNRRYGSPLRSTLIAYTVAAFGLSALAFFVVFPFSEGLLSNSSLNPNGDLYSLLSEIPQYSIYALFTAMFYFMVAKPFRLRPVFGYARGTLRLVAICSCLAISFSVMSPFNIILTARYGIGLLTFFITAMSEEWVFRGILIRVLKEKVGIVWAIVISAFMFALFHWAEIAFVSAQAPFSQGFFVAMGQDFLFGLTLGVIAWRCRSLLWVGFLHCFMDFHPFEAPGRGWMLMLHLSWLMPGEIQIFCIGILGAEVIRVCSRLTKKRSGNPKMKNNDVNA